MEYISSDTNVWIDFYKISKTQLPFRMSCKYIMFHEVIECVMGHRTSLMERSGARKLKCTARALWNMTWGSVTCYVINKMMKD